MHGKLTIVNGVRLGCVWRRLSVRDVSRRAMRGRHDGARSGNAVPHVVDRHVAVHGPAEAETTAVAMHGLRFAPREVGPARAGGDMTKSLTPCRANGATRAGSNGASASDRRVRARAALACESSERLRCRIRLPRAPGAVRSGTRRARVVRPPRRQSLARRRESHRSSRSRRRIRLVFYQYLVRGGILLLTVLFDPYRRNQRRAMRG